MKFLYSSLVFLRTLYCSPAYPHSAQSITVWGEAGVCIIQPTITIMNDILLTILEVKFDETRVKLMITNGMHLKLKFCNVYQYYLLQFLNFDRNGNLLSFNNFLHLWSPDKFVILGLSFQPFSSWDLSLKSPSP